MDQSKSKSAQRSSTKSTRQTARSKRIFSRDPGAEARRAARKQAAKKR